MHSPAKVNTKVENPEIRPFRDLRDKGLLWMINTTIFHPRGMYFALCYDKGVDANDPNVHPIGFLVRTIGEQMVYTDEDANAGYRAFYDYLQTLVPHPGFPSSDPPSEPVADEPTSVVGTCFLCNDPITTTDDYTEVDAAGVADVMRQVHVRCIDDFVESGRPLKDPS